MLTKRPTQVQRVLAVLADGQWHSTSAIHRRAGNMVLHSRIADARSKGHTIEHRTVPGRVGPTAHQYRWLEAPGLPPAVNTEPVVTTDELWPRDPQHRYRLYARESFDAGLQVVAACATPEAVGVALVALGGEGEWRDRAFGLMDTMPDGQVSKTGRWLVLPWEPR